MKKILIAALLALLPGVAFAQTVVQLPIYTQNNPGQVVDLGNGPLELRVLQGNAQIATSQGSGVGSGSTTSITLTATPAIPPCIGCSISGGTLTTSSHVTAFNGTTTITTDTSQTVAASTPLSWGAACPTTWDGRPVMQIQAGSGGDLPLYTAARVCASGQYAPGAVLLPFAIGAH